MAQLIKQWFGCRIEKELRDAIEWQHKLARASITQPDQIKSEAERYRFDGAKLYIDLGIHNPNRPFVQFVGFVKRVAPFPCYLADGEHVLAARFTAECEEKFKTTTKREIPRIASGAFLQLVRADLIINPSGSKVPITLQIHEVVGTAIATTQRQVGHRNELTPVLGSLLDTLTDQVKQNPNWDLHTQALAQSQANPFLVRTDLARDEYVQHGTSFSSRNQESMLMSQITAPKINNNPGWASEFVQPGNPEAGSDSTSSIRSARITTKMRRGGGQMYDRRVFHESAVDGRIYPEIDSISKPAHSRQTHYTEEDEEDDDDGLDVLPAVIKKHQDRVDSSIDSDTRSPPNQGMEVNTEQNRDRNPLAPNPEVHGSRQIKDTLPPKTLSLEKGQGMDVGQHEHLVSSSGSRNAADHAMSSRQETWLGITRIVRSFTVVPPDQMQLLKGETSQYPATTGTRFPPGNVPTETLQELSRRAEKKRNAGIVQDREHVGTSSQTHEAYCRVTEDANEADIPPSLDQASSPSSALPWSSSERSPAQESRGSLPPDSSAIAPMQGKVRRMRKIGSHDVTKSSRKVRESSASRSLYPRPTTASEDKDECDDEDEDEHLEMETSIPQVFGMASASTSGTLDGTQSSSVHSASSQVLQTDSHNLPDTAPVTVRPLTPQKSINVQVPESTGHESVFTQLEEQLASQTQMDQSETSQLAGHWEEDEQSVTRQLSAFRSSEESSLTRIPCSHQPPTKPCTQPSRVGKSFDERISTTPKRQQLLSSPIQFSNQRGGAPNGPEISRKGPDIARREQKTDARYGYHVAHDSRRTARDQSPVDFCDSAATHEVSQLTQQVKHTSQHRSLEVDKEGHERSRQPARDVPDTGARQSDRAPSRRVTSEFAARADSFKADTQASSSESHDPALNVTREKTAFLDTVYTDRGLYNLFTAAYPEFRADEQKFSAIVKFQLWPVRDELPPKILDDFVFQYQRLYEPYLLEQMMQGKQSVPYLELYRKNADPVVLPNKIITSRRLEEFMEITQRSGLLVLDTESKISKQEKQSQSPGVGSYVSFTQRMDSMVTRTDQLAMQQNRISRTGSGKRAAEENPGQNQAPKRQKAVDDEFAFFPYQHGDEDDGGIGHWYHARRRRGSQQQHSLHRTYTKSFSELKSNSIRDDAGHPPYSCWNI